MGRQGVRSPWSEMPRHVRDGIDQVAGSAVIDATNLEGGFSPGPAARCTLADGRTIFVKAGGLDLNPSTPAMHRREGQILAGLGPGVPAPELLGVYDDGDWVALAITWVDGVMPQSPLRPDDVTRLLALVERVASIEGHAGLESCADAHSGLFGHWQRLIDRPLDNLDTWSTRHLEDLAQIESGAPDAIRGDRLVHLDLRSDNVIFAATGPQHDVVVDWPGASIGAAWVDLVGLLPALELDGGPTPEELFDQHPLGKAADPGSVTAFVAAIAGCFTRQSLLPSPIGLPTVRSFQAAQGRVARRWTAARLGWNTDEVSK